ncbi:MAG: hypothetical protein AW09_004612 [Candidatus Accumulibacter phosphatis]|uniref:Uncharacterized protein n=1 Tax=Candidatus Accumulibacter phosphatis TaxID=327160 RepID=A0A084Y6G4_9PROT|nr:MAG: hypothetical protein AW09_004612 [Candidatus Accumulibacter phosphatis]
MNSAPTEVLVATEYMTITIDGGIRMPSAPDVVITPAPNLFGKPALTIAGMRIEPIATTVAGDDPETAANSAQARTPARPRPPYQCPTMLVANLIIRRATPPWVRKLPARMKNGMAMISNFSMPVNSLRATDSSGTWVNRKRKLSTVRPSEIEIGMPVSISTSRMMNMIEAFMIASLPCLTGLPTDLRGGVSCRSGHADAGCPPS